MDNETITESDIWADIDKVFSLPEREPGDIDARQMMERYGVCESAARTKMYQLVHSGAWKYVWVLDGACRNGRKKVLRKV